MHICTDVSPHIQRASSVLAQKLGRRSYELSELCTTELIMYQQVPSPKRRRRNTWTMHLKHTQIGSLYKQPQDPGRTPTLWMVKKKKNKYNSILIPYVSGVFENLRRIFNKHCICVFQTQQHYKIETVPLERLHTQTQENQSSVCTFRVCSEECTDLYINNHLTNTWLNAGKPPPQDKTQQFTYSWKIRDNLSKTTTYIFWIGRTDDVK